MFQNANILKEGLSTEIIPVGLKDLQRKKIGQEETHEAIIFFPNVLLLSSVQQPPVGPILSTGLYSKHLYY